MCSEEVKNAERQEIFELISDFFNYYYTERNCDRVMTYFAEQAQFVGTTNTEIAFDKKGCREIIAAQMRSVSKSIPYFVREYSLHSYRDGVWNYYGFIELTVVSKEWGTAKYSIRCTCSVVKIDGVWKIVSVHVSESTPFESASHKFEKDSVAVKRVTQKEMDRLMPQMIPGSFVSRYTNAGSPISIVNAEYLKMLKYPTLYDYMEACDGLFENSVHPDDLDKYAAALRFTATTWKQCECRYRIRCGDGKYIWVRDTLRRAVSTDRRPLVVSILTNISQDIADQSRLEMVTETDALTSLLNRRGAMKHFENLAGHCKKFCYFMIDVDNFKLVNDLYGHKEGDSILRYVAELLTEAFGGNAIICRLGGDEFSVFLPDWTDVGGLEKILNEIEGRYVARITKSCKATGSSLSFGGVYGAAAVDIETVFDAADRNLYKVKANHKKGILLTELPQA